MINFIISHWKEGAILAFIFIFSYLDGKVKGE